MSALTERQIQAINRFPDQNPNPVMRISRDGELLYANASSEPVRLALGGIDIGGRLPDDFLEPLWAVCSDPSLPPVEVSHEHRTYSLLPVLVEDLGFINLYGTDVTAQKAVDKFPHENPNPVFRVTDDGHLLYANTASQAIVGTLGVKMGDPLPRELAERVMSAADGGSAGPIEIEADRRSYSLKPVRVPEFGFINVYGTDITAQKAIDRFPGQNPNPVMRMTPDGVLIYANVASGHIVAELGLKLGAALPSELLGRLRAALADESAGPVEVVAGRLTYELHPVDVPEFGFVNVYGTDVTAARQIAELNRENERLLLNILPPAIASRLRAGERVIADRFEDATLLIADIVGFTGLSSELSADELVELLNEIFSVCDVLIERHGLEKVKTIGDAYWVIGGVPVAVDDHVERVANFALDMATAVDALQASGPREVSFRIGINIGPVVAGVIGTKRTIYDVWGDTVNLASRMESYGEPGRIHVSQAVYERLRDRYRFEPRGLLEIKGKGPLPTWFLLGRLAE